MRLRFGDIFRGVVRKGGCSATKMLFYTKNILNSTQMDNFNRNQLRTCILRRSELRVEDAFLVCSRA